MNTKNKKLLKKYKKDLNKSTLEKKVDTLKYLRAQRREEDLKNGIKYTHSIIENKKKYNRKKKIWQKPYFLVLPYFNVLYTINKVLK